MQRISILIFGLVSFFTFTAFAPNLSEEYGVASYYADSLHGNKTASGERYDKKAMTCAHKSLAFGTKIRVTRLDNDKSVIVKVNDRGNFAKGHIVDISRAAAVKLDLIQSGRARVKVEVIEEEPENENAEDNEGEAENEAEPKKTVKTIAKKEGASKVATLAEYDTEDEDPEPVAPKKQVKSKSKTGKQSLQKEIPAEEAVKTTDLYKVDIKKSPKKGYGVQLSSIYDAANLLPMMTKLQQQYPGKVLVHVETNETEETKTYRVIIGPFGDKKSAEQQQRNAMKKGYKSCFIVDLKDM